MKPKQLKLIVTFQTTTSAMAMEQLCMEKKVPGRLIPVPREITAGCGMAWCAPVEDRGVIEEIVKQAGIETSGLCEILL